VASPCPAPARHVLRWNALPQQVSAPLAGNVSFAPDNVLVCPAGNQFQDMYGGLYQGGNVLVPQSFQPTGQSLCPAFVLASMLQFSCTHCGSGAYAAAAGRSSGVPGAALNPGCQPCPEGAVCADGAVTAAPGYWGAVDNGTASVSLVPCPKGYCCPASPCASVGDCAGNRVGVLCGDCAPGFVEGLGSPACVPTPACPRDAGLIWSVLVLGTLASAALQVTFVSGVWLARGPPTGKMKLVIYFAQVRVCVSLVKL
jgi:hypothetical protein